MITKITDHEQRAIDLLLSQFRNKENFQKVIAAIAASIQDVENVGWDLRTNRGLSTAEGAQLDGIGEIVGEPRRGRNDTDYRVALQLKIKVNVSEGDPETLIELAAALTGATEVQYLEHWPANVELLYDTATIPANIMTNLKRVVPAGVGLYLTTTLGETPLVFDGDPDGAGFNELVIPSYGLITEAVTATADYGLVTDAVVDSDDYGLVTAAVENLDSSGGIFVELIS